MFSVTHIHKIICTKILQILLSVVDLYRKCNKVTQDAGLKNRSPLPLQLVVGVVADERLDSFFVCFRPLAGLPFIQEKFVSNQNILPSVHQVIKSQSRAEDCRACAWACAGVQMSYYVYRVGMLFQVLRVRLGCLFPVEHNC